MVLLGHGEGGGEKEDGDVWRENNETVVGEGSMEETVEGNNISNGGHNDGYNRVGDSSNRSGSGVVSDSNSGISGKGITALAIDGDGTRPSPLAGDGIFSRSTFLNSGE